MPLKEHETDTVGAGGQVHAGLVTLRQHAQTGGIELLAGHRVPARVRHIEAGVDVIHQRMPFVHDAVWEHSPDLGRLRHAVLAIAELQHRVGRQAGTQGRGDVLPGPVDHPHQGCPEGLCRQLRTDHVGARDDQRVQALFADLLERLVVTRDVLTRRGATRQLRQGEGVDVKLRDRVALADQAEELSLGRPQRLVRHHVAQTDVQFADVLVHGPVGRQHLQALFAQAREGRQVIMGNYRHGGVGGFVS